MPSIMSDRRRQLLSHAFYNGPKFLAISSMISAAGLSVFWAKSASELVVLLITLVPALGLAGATFGLALFPIAHWIVDLFRIRVAFWPVAHTLLVTTLLFALVLPWAAWVAGDIDKALHGRQGTYILFVPAVFAGLLAGVLFGTAMQRYAGKLSRDATERDAT